MVLDGDRIFVTNNDVDFRRLAAEHGLHPGLIVLSQGRVDQQREWMHEVIDFIEAVARAADEMPDDRMVCRIVVYDQRDRSPSWEWLPEPLPGRYVGGVCQVARRDGPRVRAIFFWPPHLRLCRRLSRSD